MGQSLEGKQSQETPFILKMGEIASCLCTDGNDTIVGERKEREEWVAELVS